METPSLENSFQPLKTNVLKSRWSMTQPKIIIRQVEAGDWPRIWQMLEPVFAEGATYAFACDMTEQQAKQVWLDNNLVTYVAQNEAGDLVGTFYLKANFAGNADHICNCGYIVAEQAQGKGVASFMCKQSQQIALQLGFRAMQFNFVVSTNRGAIALWKKLGFEIVGTLPKAFRHPDEGMVDAHIMFKSLI